MNIFETYEHLIRVEMERMVSAGDLPAADFSRLSVNPPRDIAHGELATNAALIAGDSNLAGMLATHFVSLHDVIDANAADNGLVNLTLKPVVWHRAVSSVLHGAKNDPCHRITHGTANDFSLTDAVFTVQYARSFCCAVLRHSETALQKDLSDNALANAHFNRLITDNERALMRKIAGWHHAADNGERAKDVYAHELALIFRNLAAKQSGDAAMGFVITNDTELSLARLALVRATSIILAEAQP